MNMKDKLFVYIQIVYLDRERSRDDRLRRSRSPECLVVDDDVDSSLGAETRRRSSRSSRMVAAEDIVVEQPPDESKPGGKGSAGAVGAGTGGGGGAAALTAADSSLEFVRNFRLHSFDSTNFKTAVYVPILQDCSVVFSPVVILDNFSGLEEGVGASESRCKNVFIGAELMSRLTDNRVDHVQARQFIFGFTLNSRTDFVNCTILALDTGGFESYKEAS
uniref:Uncharacterized protein n=1 Tax=Romanomermis culicivorax TaxID=13658 RepID=A0A915IA25_ROMCU